MIGTIAEIRMFAGNFTPASWASCIGSLLPITEYPALFSLVGTAYGGDGRTSFGLPDLRGRTPVGNGQGPGLSYRYLGELYGWEYNQLSEINLPTHTHVASISGSTSISASTHAGSSGNSNNPQGRYWGPAGLGQNIYSDAAAVEMAVDAVAVDMDVSNMEVDNSYTGGNEEFSICQPSSVINFIICLESLYPSRN